jgi:hypothetical protein
VLDRLSSVNPKATVILSGRFDGPADKHRELALGAIKVITEWSLLESALLSLFVKMLGANPAPGAAMYAALTGSTAQNSALLALAKLSFSHDNYELFHAVLEMQKSTAKKTNKLVHWVWHYSAELPDAALLCDPKDILQHKVELKSWMDNGSNGSAPILPNKNIVVVRIKDLHEIFDEVRHLILLFMCLEMVLNGMDSPISTPLRTLLSEPTIQKELSRRRQHQRTAQEVQRQSPSQDRSENED